MAELVLDTNTLPESLLQMIRSEKVKVNETNGVISLTPIVGIKGDCPLRGLAADSKLTVEKFIAMTHDEADSIALAQTLILDGELLTSDHHEFDVIEEKEDISFCWIR